MDEQFSEAEENLRRAADEELDALAVARRATGALATAIEGTTISPAPDPAPPDYYLKSAIFNLCVIALRSARACMVLIASGYEPEAHGQMRRVMEVHTEVSAILDDTSGQRARQWLEGKPPAPRRTAAKYGNQELYDLYSQSDHADARGVWAWLAVEMPETAEGHTGLQVAPNRRPEFANTMLVELAHGTRDLANLMARSRGESVPDLDDLDRAIIEARERWYSGEPE